MKYALLIYSAPGARPAETSAEEMSAAWVAYTRALKSAGALVAVQRLQDVDTATTVRLRGGERLLTDGPYVEAKEFVASFSLIQAENYDAAVAIARECPGDNVIEIRELGGYA